ncbi:MAG: helix-turn-helix transcriptional regulator, partial [Lepagella sp.]
MKLVSSHIKLADIIFHDPAAITVLNRFGIRLGVGSATLGQACALRNLDAPFVEAILNISLNEDYFPERALKTFTLPLLEEYLLGTDRYYTRMQLPNIARHLDSLISHSPDGGNLELLRGFFGDLSRELTARAEAELKAGHCLKDDWQPVSDTISDLLSFFVV